jgi:hypothetical protein
MARTSTAGTNLILNPSMVTEMLPAGEAVAAAVAAAAVAVLHLPIRTGGFRKMNKLSYRKRYSYKLSAACGGGSNAGGRRRAAARPPAATR